MNRQHRLQQDIPEDAKAQENEKLQVAASAYLVLITRHQTVHGAYGKE